MLKRNCHCIVSKAYLEFLKKQENPGPIDRLSTIVHEFFHWKDAQEAGIYREKRKNHKSGGAYKRMI